MQSQQPALSAACVWQGLVLATQVWLDPSGGTIIPSGLLRDPVLVPVVRLDPEGLDWCDAERCNQPSRSARPSARFPLRGLSLFGEMAASRSEAEQAHDVPGASCAARKQGGRKDGKVLLWSLPEPS